MLGGRFEQWSLTREFLKQYLTEKQNGYLESGYGRWSLTRGGRHERVDCRWSHPSTINYTVFYFEIMIKKPLNNTSMNGRYDHRSCEAVIQVGASQFIPFMGA